MLGRPRGRIKNCFDCLEKGNFLGEDVEGFTDWGMMQRQGPHVIGALSIKQGRQSSVP